MVTESKKMRCEDALQVIAGQRWPNQIVVTNQMSARVWPGLSDHPLDFNYLSSTMGGAIPFGLGLAIAQPGLEVIVLSGDGSLLMSLGCLVSVAASQVTNLTIILLDNAQYEVTGGQKTAAALANVDYATLATAAGFAESECHSELDTWQSSFGLLVSKPGPRFVWLQVNPVESETYRHAGIDVADEFIMLRRELTRSG